jgi:hypothetical protein
MLTCSDTRAGSVLAVKATGELSVADWQAFIARLEPVVRDHSSARILFELQGFEGWDPASAWDDLTFSLRFRDCVRRFAVVGEPKDRKWMRRLGEAFANARLFTPGQREAAWLWVAEGAVSGGEKEEVRRLAYAKWEAAGRPSGNDLAFWVEAERELHQAS